MTETAKMPQTAEDRSKQFLVALADLQERYGVQLIASFRATFEAAGNGLLRPIAEPIIQVVPIPNWHSEGEVDQNG